MILPCNREQFEALNNLFNYIMANTPTDIKKSLAHSLLKPIQKKLNTRVNAKVSGKRGWNLSLTEMQAKAYYTTFEGRYLGDKWVYEQLTIDRHLKLINKTYG